VGNCLTAALGNFLTVHTYRLVTTILDPGEAPASELAPLYAQRWEFESALDEMKSHQRGPRVVLRSKAPEGVRQEAWGYLCAHYAIRALMADAANDQGVDPDRISDLLHPQPQRRPSQCASGTWCADLHTRRRARCHNHRDLP
jgi:hypothetical protein